MLSIHQVPFLLHLLVEVPPCINFFFNPDGQLAKPQPYAHAVIRQYAMLLLSTNIIAAIFIVRPTDEIARQVAGALAVYHIGPMLRALERLRGEDDEPTANKGPSSLGGPGAHWAIEFLCDSRFHQSLWLPPKPNAGRTAPLRVTYADVGYRDPTNPGNETIILFVGGMSGGRYCLAMASADKLAKKYKVRLLCTDRPAIGGSTGVVLEERVNTWLETVPALLQHLNIKHVSIVSHSAGTVYTMNTLLVHRSILHPTKPYVALCVPWVHHSHSAATAMVATNFVPESVVGKYHNLASFFVKNVNPMIGFSSGILNSLAAKGPDIPSSDDPDIESKDMSKARMKLLMKYFFAESTEGCSQEALLCLKRGKNHLWGEWEDYDKYVPLLAEQENKDQEGSKLEVDVYYAEDDMMIGKKGPVWFDSCWEGRKKGDRISYESHNTKGTNHESILDAEYGVFEKILRKVSNSLQA
ncbi:MAG: hypothetical protein M1827_006604 [Pycnora praestabilis]|nr:MAG: hypothetical protein M1827_006604 [Pycnora praestabilis]